MNHVKYLEFDRIMKELQFVESDYKYQSEVMRVSDSEFLKSVDFILSQFPELNEIYRQKQDSYYKVINENIKESKLETETEEISIIETTEDLESKKLYRDIVKTTHPDKIKNNRLNDLYIEATEAYDQNDIITLYKVCSELNIEFELPETHITMVMNKISDLKKRIGFLENTYTSKWIKCDDINGKNKIVIDFIRSKVI